MTGRFDDIHWRANPGRFGHLASLPLPYVPGALDALAYALDELDSNGFTIETNSAGVYLGDDRYEPLYRELNRRRAVVFVHPTSPPCAEAIALGRPRPMLEFIFDTTRTVSDLVFTGTLARYPDVEWVFTHGGGALPVLADRMELFRTVFSGDDDPDSAVPRQLRRLRFDIAGMLFPRQLPAAVAAFGTGRLLYGSDYCWTPAHAVDAQLASIDQPDQPADDSWRALTTRNATRCCVPTGSCLPRQTPASIVSAPAAAGSQVIPLNPKTTAQSLAGWKTLTADRD